MKPLAVCAIFKNEAPYLLEWLAYHRVIGFDRFVLYDNDSTDGGAGLIRSSALAERATVIHWPQRPGQLSAYQHFIDCFAREFEWAAFIDLDEFLLPVGGDSIVPLLTAWSGFSAVLARWRCFGPSGRAERAEGLVIENYVTRLDDDQPINRSVKSIVKCSDLEGISATPHYFHVRGPVCDTRGTPALNIPVQHGACHDNLVINHYITKSRQDWREKLRRGSPDRDDSRPTYDAGVFDALSGDATVHDTAITRFAPRIRDVLAQAVAGAEKGGGPDDGPRVATRLVRLDPGLFSLTLDPGPKSGDTGLPAVRVSPPPGPAGAANAVSISSFRADGWLTGGDEPTLIRVARDSAEVLVTIYWSAADRAPPAPRLTRLA